MLAIQIMLRSPEPGQAIAERYHVRRSLPRDFEAPATTAFQVR
jgi:hypothetical protein